MICSSVRSSGDWDGGGVWPEIANWSRWPGRRRALQRLVAPGGVHGLQLWVEAEAVEDFFRGPFKIAPHLSRPVKLQEIRGFAREQLTLSSP